MSNLHRKTLMITIRNVCKPKDDDCDDHLPPPDNHHPLSPLKIMMICTLAAAISFICYIVIIKTYRVFKSRWRRRIIRSQESTNSNQTRHDFIDEVHEDHEPVVFHPIWLINTIGLDQSVIDSIQMFKYRKEDGLIDETDSDCAVCLGSFEDDENLRLLPKCSHAFHVDCIDTWLRSHKNCPLCRAPVVNNNTTTTTSNHHVDQNFVGTSAQEQIPFNVHQSSTQEIDTNCETGVRVQSNLSDHCSQKHEPMRRSVSLGSLCVVDQESEQLVVSQNPSVVSKTAKSRGSSSRLGVCSRATKSSSFGPRIDLGGF